MMLRRSVFRTSQRLFPLRGNFPSFNHKEVFSFEPEHWEVSGAPPETIQSDPTTGWTQESRRVGTIAQKIGMTYEFDDWLEFVPLTALFVFIFFYFILFYLLFLQSNHTNFVFRFLVVK